MSDCVFCKISNKEDSNHQVVWEHDRFMALLTIQPVKEGHVLVIPKWHVEDVMDMNDVEYAELMVHARALAVSLKSIFVATKVVIATEGLSVSHAHVHLVPVHHKGDLGITNHISATPEALHRTAEKIRQSLYPHGF